MDGGKTANRAEHSFIADLEKDRQHAAANQDYSVSRIDNCIRAELIMAIGE